MAPDFNFLHLKRNRGGPNELTFDVLDAARHQLDSQQRGRGEKKSSPVLAVGGAVSHASSLAAEDEVRRRKRQRHRRSLTSKALAALVIGCLLCAGVLISYSLYQQKVDFNSRVTALVASIVTVDETLVQADSLMKDPFANYSVPQRQELTKALDGLDERLERIVAQAYAVNADAAEGDEQATIAEVQAAIAARVDLLAAAQDAFSLAETIYNFASEGDRIWARVIDADQSVRRAAALANQATTQESAKESRQVTEEAMAAFREAKASLAKLNSKVKGLNLSAQAAYLDMRVEGLGFALATTDALLAGNREEATRANEEYNRIESEAARAAEELPASVGSVVSAAFAERQQQVMETYQQARAAVTKADADLRTRL